MNESGHETIGESELLAKEGQLSEKTNPSSKAPTSPEPSVSDLIVWLDEIDLDAMEAEDLRWESGELSPIPTPWKYVNEQLMGGLYPGLHVFVSNTGVGKTTLAIQIGVYAATDGHPVLYISTEIKQKQMAHRIMGERLKFAWSDLQNAHFKQENYKNQERQQNKKPPPTSVAKRYEQYRKLPAIPFSLAKGISNGWNIGNLPLLAKAMKSRNHDQPGLIVLDYLQMIGNGDDRADARQRISAITNFVHDIAEEYGVAILAISSTGRDNYAQDQLIEKAGISWVGDKPVILNPDAIVGLGKESGDIEYSADTVNVLLKAGWDEHGSLENPEKNGGNQMVVFATSKFRAGSPSWCELRSSGYRFDSPQEGNTNKPVRYSQKLRDELDGNKGGQKTRKQTNTPTNPPTNPPAIPLEEEDPRA